MKVALGGIFEISSGGTPSKTHAEYYDGNIPWVKTGDLKSEYLNSVDEYITDEGLKNSSAKMYEPGTVLLAMYGATIGAASILTFNACTNQACAAFKPCKDVIPEYLYYFLLSRREKFIHDGVGGAQPNISGRYLKQVEFELYPINEQRFVISVLDRVNRIISLKKEEIKKLDELIKARFVEMFGSVEKKIPLSTLCDISGGYSFKSGDITSDGAVKILQIGNVYLDDISWENTNYLPKGYDETYSRFLLNKGDIVVALTRPIIQSLGNVKACIVRDLDLPCLLNQRVGRIVPRNNKEVSNQFIYGCLMTCDFTRYVKSCCIGCSQPNISSNDIGNYMIPDVSFNEQMMFVNFKEQIDKSKVVVPSKIKNAIFAIMLSVSFGQITSI